MIDIIPDPDPVMVGRRLDALREALDIKEQKDFAALIGLDDSSYSKIKKGKKPLTAAMAYRAGKRFGVPMGYFFDGDVSHLPENLRNKVITYLGGQTA